MQYFCFVISYHEINPPAAYKTLKSERDALDISEIALKNQYEWQRTMLTYTSNAIEGNTLSHMETSLVINDGISVQGKKIVEIQETLNHAKAIDYIKKLSGSLKIHEITQEHILAIHKFILHDIHQEYAGIYRNIPVRITGSRTILPNPIKVTVLMDMLEQRIKKTEKHPCWVASELHYRFVSIHPFVDGNGRTARLLSNLVLLIAGYPMMIIHTEKRKEYIDMLEARQVGGNEEEYHKMMLGYMKESLEEQVTFYSL